MLLKNHTHNNIILTLNSLVVDIIELSLGFVEGNPSLFSYNQYFLLKDRVTCKIKKLKVMEKLISDLEFY